MTWKTIPVPFPTIDVEIGGDSVSDLIKALDERGVKFRDDPETLGMFDSPDFTISGRREVVKVAIIGLMQLGWTYGDAPSSEAIFSRANKTFGVSTIKMPEVAPRFLLQHPRQKAVFPIVAMKPIKVKNGQLRVFEVINSESSDPRLSSRRVRSDPRDHKWSGGCQFLFQAPN